MYDALSRSLSHRNQLLERIRTSPAAALSTFDPELEAIAGSVSKEAYGKALVDANRRYYRQFGRTATGAAVQANPVGQPLALAAEFKGLQLPPLDFKQLSVQFQTSGNAFTSGVDRLIAAWESGAKGMTVNLSAPITVQASGDRAIAQKTGESVQTVLGRVVGQAAASAKSRR